MGEKFVSHSFGDEDEAKKLKRGYFIVGGVVDEEVPDKDDDLLVSKHFVLH